MLTLPSTAMKALDTQRGNLAAMAMPSGIAPPLSMHIKQAINNSFVAGFRAVMLIGAALAVGSAFISLLLIQGKRHESAKGI
jgi:hypothetical protein